MQEKNERKIQILLNKKQLICKTYFIKHYSRPFATFKDVINQIVFLTIKNERKVHAEFKPATTIVD